MEQALHGRLTGYAGLAALVGARVMPAPLPEGVVLPAVGYQLVSDLPNVTLTGADGFYAARYQVTVWAMTRLAAVTVAKQVRAALNNWAGVHETITVQFAVCANAMDLFDTDFTPGWYGRALDVEIYYTR